MEILIDRDVVLNWHGYGGGTGVAGTWWGEIRDLEGDW